MSRTLVIGLSGQLGAAAQAGLLARGEALLALSRHPPAPTPGIDWQAGTLDTLEAPPADVGCILSLGPLDAFAAWTARVRPAARRIVAIGSTGRVDKLASPDARERDEAQRLAAAEETLLAYGRAQGAAVTLLRPTLLYGSGRDSLSRLAALARRWRVLPLPANAVGRRQPVHVDDVARAVLACIDADGSHGRAFDLPGAEALPFDAMVRRTLAARAPGARLLRLPASLFRAGCVLAGRPGRADGWLHRLARDQVADPAAAAEAFAYAPRAFEP